MKTEQTTTSPVRAADAPVLTLAARAELLLKYYTIRDGAEETNLAPLLQKNGHLEIFKQMLQQSTADVSDLIQSTQSFTAAQFYASLVRIKQKDEEQQAKAQLELLKPAGTATTRNYNKRRLINRRFVLSAQLFRLHLSNKLVRISDGLVHFANQAADILL